MKRVIIYFLLVFLAVNVFAAVNIENVGDKAVYVTETVDEFKDANPINLDTGEVDAEKLKNIKDYSPINLTAAEVRIGKINDWLKENATWLKVVFGMVPSLTWLFAVNLWLWLWFLVVLGLNADKTFGWMPFFNEEKFDFVFFYTTWAQLFGLGVFALIVILKWVAIAANLVYGLLYAFWNYVLPYGILAMILFDILIFTGIISFIPFTVRALNWIKKKEDARREEKAKEKERARREQLEAFSKEAWGGRFD